ncbi:MAG: hypothetical protein JJ866_26180 [Roseibium sp.]|uniref:hypothetical protein n=1 Tax=Roseibium sp. TaxID=1936156 RepID=UPI001B0841E0|nr:hypothetical protein [Roseibium sp.]MBO6509612.1 hypothetical protein [Roseibium sp.]MBO6895445.1 hypothetical protein [Roseibium sp.]MBO6931568.1 hypothetical protein [Roseibium sp.]
MLQDKKSETDGERQKVLLRRLVNEVSRENPDLYYQSTSQVARTIRDHIAEGRGLNREEQVLMQRLNSRDLEILLSLH